MLYLLLAVLIFFMIRYFHYYLLCQRQKMVSDLADSRRQLIGLVNKGMIDPRSEIFKFYYKAFELLIQIQYGKKDHLLPNPFQAVKAISSRCLNSKTENIKIEMTELQKKDQTREIHVFFHQASAVLIDSLIKNKQVVLLLFTSKLAILLSKLRLLKVKYWYLKMVEYNDEIKDMKAILAFSQR